MEKNDSSSIDTSKTCLYKTYSFNVKNSSVDSFGFELYIDDESTGAKSLSIDSDFVYITDAYHSEVKKININTGEIVSSRNNSPNYLQSFKQFNDIIVFNDNVLIPAYDSLYTFSKQLKLLNSIKIQRGEKYIERVDSDKLFIYINDHQLSDLSTEYEYLVVDKANSVSTIKENISIGDYEKKSKIKKIQGKNYDIYSNEGKTYFRCEYGTIELKTMVPEIKHYAARNLNFNKSTLVFFDSTPKKLTLYVYRW